MRLLILFIVCSLFAIGCSSSTSTKASDSSITQPISAARSEDDQLLDAALEDALLDPKFESDRISYGTPGDHSVFITGEAPYRPILPKGWTATDPVTAARQKHENPRRLAIEVRRGRSPTTIRSISGKPVDATVTITFYNTGGPGDALTIGGTSVHYEATKTPQGWKLRWTFIASSRAGHTIDSTPHPNPLSQGERGSEKLLAA